MKKKGDSKDLAKFYISTFALTFSVKFRRVPGDFEATFTSTEDKTEDKIQQISLVVVEYLEYISAFLL